MLIAFALAAPVLARTAGAECASTKVGGADARKLASVARATAAPRRLVKSSLEACVNPDGARASYDAQPEARMDGSVLHPHVLCHRETGPWSCVTTTLRTARIDVTRDGARQLHEFELPSWLEVDDARRLVRLAFALGPTVSNSKRCEASGAEPSIAGGQASGGETPLGAPGARRIVAEPDSVGVVIDRSYLKFVLSPDRNNWQFICAADLGEGS